MIDRTKIYAASEFLASDPNEDETGYVADIMAPMQPLVIGGPPKSCKTIVAFAMAIALATGTAFLGRFAVPVRRRVLYASGETGRPILRRLAAAMLQANNLEPDALTDHFFFTEWVPNAGSNADRARLSDELSKYEPHVLILDPQYLVLGGTNVSVADVYAMGRALRQINELCLQRGTTLTLCHHFNRKGKDGGYPTLTDLSMAGSAEFFAQWILLRRARAYESDGIHDLLMVAGGRGSRGDKLQVRIDEGRWPNLRWEVATTTGSEVAQQNSEIEIEMLVKALRALSQKHERVSQKMLGELLSVSGTKVGQLVRKASEAGRIMPREAKVRGKWQVYWVATEN